MILRYLLSTLLLSMFCSLTVQAANLRSVKVRADLCNILSEELSDAGLDGSVDIIPEFEKVCSKAKDSFVVTNSDYNVKAKAVVKLEIDIKFIIKNKVEFKGSAVYERAAFDPKTGKVKLENFKLVDSNISFVLGNEVIEMLAEVIASTADIHNGDSRVKKYVVSSFDAKKEIKFLNKEIKKKNNTADYCLMLDSEVNAKWMIKENEEHNDDKTAISILDLLDEQGLIVEVIGSQAEDWTESCAFYDVYIYLKNGSLIVINYDFTT